MRRVVEAPLALLRAEERPDEVVRIAEVTRPADQVEGAGGSGLHATDVVRAATERSSATTLKPDLFRLAANAWKFRAGSGMYGRDTSVGYQNSTSTGSVRPACCRSCFALAGLYGYFVTSFA